MKIFLITLVTLVLNRNVFANNPLSGDDRNLAKGSVQQAEAGSTFQSAVGKDGQPAICEKCEENKKAMLSNNVGVLLSGDGKTVKDSSGKPVGVGH